MNNIKTIIFDLGGVLVDLNREASIKAFDKIGYPHSGELLGLYGNKGLFNDLEMGLISADEFHQEIRKSVNAPVSDRQIDDALNQFLEGIPDFKLDMLAELKASYKILMLSNTNIIMMDHIKEYFFKKQGHDVYYYFDQLFLSYELKCIKPGEEIYDKMIESSGINPQECLYIDDSQLNNETAKKLGFKTYLATPHEDFRHIFNNLDV